MDRYVVVEGVIGAGKTTLCRALAAAWGADLLLEPHDDNPFLEPFYRDPARYALPVQMSFLLTRFRQSDTVRQLKLFRKGVVSDYVLEKDRLFAQKTLSQEDLHVYERVADALGATVVAPDLVVVLHAPVSVLLERIARRGIAGEDRIDRPYLEDLARRYDALWANWRKSPVLHLDTTALPYDRDEQVRNAVVARIEAALEGRDGETSEASLPRQGVLFPR